MMCYGKSILNGANSGDQSPHWMQSSNHELTAAGCLTTPYAGLEPYAGKLASTVLMGKGGSNPAGLPGTRNPRLFQVSHFAPHG